MGDGFLSEGSKRMLDDEALMMNAKFISSLGELLKRSLGPMSGDKMLVDSMGDSIITNDGRSILSKLDITQPASKLLTQVSETQDAECGDGTTTCAILAGEMVMNCVETKMKWGIHKKHIELGYILAKNRVMEKIHEFVVPCNDEDLRNIAITSLNSKSASAYSKVLVEIAIQSVKKIFDKGKADVKSIKVVRKTGGSVEDSKMISGTIIPNKLQRGMPTKVQKAKVICISGALINKKINSGNADVKFSDYNEFQKFQEGEENALETKLNAIVKDNKSVVLFFSGKIDENMISKLIKNGIMAFSNVNDNDMKLVELATGAKSIDISVYNDSYSGFADSIEQIIMAEEELIAIENSTGKTATILLRGGSYNALDEIDRALHDCLMVISDVVEDRTMLPGGGAVFVDLALDLRAYANTIGGKRGFAVEAFASALESIPLTLARNGGFDEVDVLLQLRKDHTEGKKTFGIDYNMENLTHTADMVKNKVVEPFRVVRQAILSATEIAVQITRVDDVLWSKPLTDNHPELNTNPISKQTPP